MSSESDPTLEHLFEAAKVVGCANRTKTLLNSYYLSRIQGIANAEHISLAKPSNPSCNKCLISHNVNYTCSLTIKPRKIRRKKYTQLVAAYESNENLSKSKQILAKKYQKLIYNVAETTCNLCKSKQKSNIRFILKNKDKPQTQKSWNPSIVQQLSELELVKPKKRKRDKHAGLKIKDDLTISADSAPVSIKPTIQPFKLIQTKPKMNNKANNAKKSKNSKESVKKVKTITSAEKQRKNILLLANVLKMNDQKQQDSSHMNLQKMLRK